MKVRVLSDLHLEFAHFDLDHIGEDVLILAGDISTDPSDVWNMLRGYPATVPVLYVFGNHEYYGKSIEQTHREFRLALPGVRFLQNDLITIGKYLFAGTTLWTDLNNGQCIGAAQYMMNDYRDIHCFNPIDSLLLNSQARVFLERLPDHAIVITHHAPSFECLDPKYSGFELNGAYANTQLEHKRFKKWIHGHTHSANQTGNIVCNPRGYPGEKTNFNPDLIIEL